MLYFALTRQGYTELIAQLGHAPAALWVNEGILSALEIKQLRETGARLSNFTVQVNPHDSEDVAQAVDTIAEHHPGQTIWVEYRSDA